MLLYRSGNMGKQCRTKIPCFVIMGGLCSVGIVKYQSFPVMWVFHRTVLLEVI